MEAIALYYVENVTMQENEEPPRVGKQFCIDHEKKSLETVKSLEITILNQAIDPINEIVFNAYNIEFEILKGVKMQLNEVAVQHWNAGQIIKEKFYYKDIEVVNR